MTPVQMSRENMFKLKGLNSKRTPEVYGNRKNSVMTELINSVAIDNQKGQTKALGRGQFNQSFYIPQEHYKEHSFARRNEDNRILEERYDENKSFNSAFEGEPNPNERRNRDARHEMGAIGFPRALAGSVYSPQNLKLFQSPNQAKVAKGESGDMILDCKDFFDRSYSKILQSQKKKKTEQEGWDWDPESDLNSKYMIQNFLNSNKKSSLTRNPKKGQGDNVSTFKIAKKKFSFSKQDKRPSNLLSIPSGIGPDMSKLNLTLSPSNLTNQDAPFKNSLTGEAVDQQGLADIILHAKHGLEQDILSSPMIPKKAGPGAKEMIPFLSRADSGGFFFQGQNPRSSQSRQLGNLFDNIEPRRMEGDLKQNKYMVEEIKEALDSNSQALLSNFKSSLGSLSNKKFLKFSNSEKNKKKSFIEKKSNSGDKKEKKRAKKRNKSSSIGLESGEKPVKKGVLFGNSEDQRSLKLQNSLVPLESANRLFSGISNLETTEQLKKGGLISPFPSSLSPFLSFKQMPSTAQKTISQGSKIQSKNGDQVRIGHFTPVTPNYLGLSGQPKPAYKFENQKFDALTQNFISLDKRMKTPDSVARKLGKRGGSDAKKCQTPGSFLASDGKNKKKIRNM